MACLKCGREVQDKESFCPTCLEEMEKYPVNPDVVVTLPQRNSNAERRRAKNRPPTPAEQIARLQSANRKLRKWVTLLFLALVAVVAACILIVLWKRPEWFGMIWERFT